MQVEKSRGGKKAGMKGKPHAKAQTRQQSCVQSHWIAFSCKQHKILKAFLIMRKCMRLFLRTTSIDMWTF